MDKKTLAEQFSDLAEGASLRGMKTKNKAQEKRLFAEAALWRRAAVMARNYEEQAK